MRATLYKSSLNGVMQVPPSKSMAHRLLICAALAQGTSRVNNLQPSQDILVTQQILRNLGAEVTVTDGRAVVKGGVFPPAQPKEPLLCGESGSTLRFIIPLASFCSQPVRLTGAPRLFARPLKPYADIFAGQNKQFMPDETGLTLQGPLQAGVFELPGNVSSQFISGLLFVLPLLPQSSSIRLTPPVESRSYIELTRQAQALFGVQSNWKTENELHIPGGQQYTAANTRVEGDWSQAVVPAVLGAVCGNVAVQGLLQNSAQGDRILQDIMRHSGAQVLWQKDVCTTSYPPAGSLMARQIDLADCPDLAPVLSAFAVFCKGTTRFVNAGRLRIKESDRIAAMQQELQKMGVTVHAGEDWYEVEGTPHLQDNALVEGHNDHRIVMALAVAALCGGVQLSIQGAEAVNKSWPTFFEDITALGAKVKQYEE